MTQRYYNENPQTTYLLEKIEEQQKEIEALQNTLAAFESMCRDNSDKRIDLEVQITKYLRSSWYKRIFFNFKL